MGDVRVELRALGRWLCSVWSFGHGIPEGADDGPGLRAGNESVSGIGLCKRAEPTDKVEEGGPASVDREENGPCHSLSADPGVIGERPRFSGSSPPRARLDLNYCSCMIKF